MAKKRPQVRTIPKIGFWHMIRDVLVASLNKGQFPLACCFAVVVVVLMRMPVEDLSQLAWRLLEDLENGKLLGYALAVLLLLGWYGHSRFLRKMASNELKRITTERNKLQQDAIGHTLKSSDIK